MQGLLLHLLKKKILRLYFSAPSKKTKAKSFSFKRHWLLYVIVCSDIFAIWIDLHIAGHYNDAEDMNIIFKLWIFICGLKVAFFKMPSSRAGIWAQNFVIEFTHTTLPYSVVQASRSKMSKPAQCPQHQQSQPQILKCFVCETEFGVNYVTFAVCFWNLKILLILSKRLSVRVQFHT